MNVAGEQNEASELFGTVDRVGEVISKHYYDLFAYHAAQRLTTFNFFIVSLSFFCSAYALLLTKGPEEPLCYVVATGLASVATLLIVFFARLDRRNAQIVQLNEVPLAVIQEVIASKLAHLKTDAEPDPMTVFQTIRRSDREARRFQTFGVLIPCIYTTALALTTSGAVQALLLAVKGISQCAYVLILFFAIGVFLLGSWFIHADVLGLRKPNRAA